MTAEPAPREGDQAIHARLPLPRAAPLALQYVISLFAGAIATPLVVAEALALDPATKNLFIQAALFMSGLGTLLQARGIGPVGARLPLTLGVSFAFIGIAVTAGERFGLGAVAGGALVAGAFQLLAGRIIGRLRPLFPPLVTGLCILMIGVSLLPVGFALACGGAGATDFGALRHVGLAGGVLLIAVLLHQFAGGFLAMASIIIAILAGALAAAAMGQVDMSAAWEARWLTAPTPLPFGLSFEWSVALSCMLLSLVSIAETIGDVSGVTIAGVNRQPYDREISGGVMADGCSSMAAGLFGCLPLVTYSQNVGLVVITGVVSRHVVALAGWFMIAIGLFPKLAAAIGALPNAALGGVALLMFGSVAGAGLKMLSLVKFDARAMLIAGLTLSTGLGLPTQTALLARMPAQLRLIMEAGLPMAILVAIILQLVLPGRETRGSQRRSGPDARR